MAEVPIITIFASGSGSTAEELIKATQTDNPSLHAEVGAVICNNSHAGLKKLNGLDSTTIYERVERLNCHYGLRIPVLHISTITLKLPPLSPEEQLRGMRDEESAQCARILEDNGSRLFVAAGWMKKFTGPLLERLGLNSHPGILPLTANTIGKRASEMVLETGWPYNQHTVHEVTEEMDAGYVLARHNVPVMAGDTPDNLFARTQATEKRYLPADVDQALAWVAELGHIPQLPE